jgi:hypothetical protein
MTTDKADPAGGFPMIWIALAMLLAGGVWFFVSPDFRGGAPGNLPIEAGFRRAPAGQGVILVVRNASKRHLSLEATAKRPRSGEQKTFRLEVEPGKTAELGYREGWLFVSGDTVALSHKDYALWEGMIE